MQIDSAPQSDLVTTLGYLCLGSRLKRLGERMQGGVAQVLAGLDHRVQPAQLPILMALHIDGAMTIGALGDRVGISQPGVSRAIAALDGLGLVAAEPGGRDRRQRRIGLTDAARALMSELERTLFPAVDRAVERLCIEATPDLLATMARIEAGLVREALDRRVLRAMETD